VKFFFYRIEWKGSERCQRCPRPAPTRRRQKKSLLVEVNNFVEVLRTQFHFSAKERVIDWVKIKQNFSKLWEFSFTSFVFSSFLFIEIIEGHVSNFIWPRIEAIQIVFNLTSNWVVYLDSKWSFENLRTEAHFRWNVSGKGHFRTTWSCSGSSRNLFGPE
jgi:hypothetical protein